uniref:Response regulator n=1 Tax=candidate division CPR3 bacterium TaxID=2268181 RepID=A0A7V3JAV4_UNCC3
MKKILVVDDEPDILELIKDILKSKYDVYTAKNVKEAVSTLEKIKIDLIILDIMMPQIDGWDFLWMIRGSEKYREIPVIIVTARADAEDKLIGLKEGVKDYIVKPFLPNELINRVEEILKERAK